MRKNIKSFFILASIVLIALLTGCTKDGYVADKIHVMGVDVGDVTYDEAIDIIKGLEFSESDAVTVNADDVTFTLSATEIGAEIDPQKTVEALMEESKGFFSGWFKKDCPAVVVVDSLLFDSVVTEKLIDKECEVVQFTYTLEEDGIKAVNGKSGYKLDRAALATNVCEALGTLNEDAVDMQFTVTAPNKIDATKFLSGFSEEYKEATYQKDENGNIIVTDDVPGVKLDKAYGVSIMESHTEEGEEYLIPCEIQLSKYTREYLEKCLFRDTMGKYSTNFKTSSANRSKNIELAAGSINDLILMPGEVFSFNSSVGERTTARGYKVAAAYAAGKTVDSVGGGICQVSSTLYNSVLLANLEIVTRRSHQMTVSYVPKGRDATVNWGTQDFEFKNNTDFPIKISTTVANKNVEIAIIGTLTDLDRTVEIITNTVSVLEPGIDIVEDPTKEVGFVETKGGSKGYVVDAVRVVYSKGVEVSREKLTRSRYNPTNATQTVGTMVVGNDLGTVEEQVPVEQAPVDQAPVEQAPEVVELSETGL